MNWHILGPGSLGCLWAARLSQAHIPASLILRNQHRLTALQSQGGQISYLAYGQSSPLDIPINAQLPNHPQPIERLVVACKAYDAVAAVESIKTRLSPNSCVFLLQNGMGSQQAITQLLPGIRVIAASSTEGAFLTQPFHCTHAGQGTTLLGDLGHTQPEPTCLRDWQQAQISYQWTEAILAALWRKLAINCLINPLTVLYQCKNGQLAQHTERLTALAHELAQLLSAAGYPCTAEDVFAQCLQVIQNTAQNTSSMLQDVLNQRRTEISYITGFALAQSQQLGTSHRALLDLHSQLQARLQQLDLLLD